MLAPQVDPERDLPVAERLVPGKREIPPGTPVGFRESPFSVELAGHGRDLLGRVVTTPSFGEQIHAGRLHVLVETHGAAYRFHLVEKAVLGQHVPGVEQVVLFAPVTDLPGKCVHEQVSDAVVVVAAGAADIAAVNLQEQFRKMIHQVVPVPFSEDGRQAFRPGKRSHRAVPPQGIVRLVGKDAGYRVPEASAASLPVLLVSDLDEFPYPLVVHRVEIAVAVVPGFGGHQLSSEMKNGLAGADHGGLAAADSSQSCCR